MGKAVNSLHVAQLTCNEPGGARAINNYERVKALRAARLKKIQYKNRPAALGQARPGPARPSHEGAAVNSAVVLVQRGTGESSPGAPALHTNISGPSLPSAPAERRSLQEIRMSGEGRGAEVSSATTARPGLATQAGGKHSKGRGGGVGNGKYGCQSSFNGKCGTRGTRGNSRP